MLQGTYNIYKSLLDVAQFKIIAIYYTWLDLWGMNLPILLHEQESCTIQPCWQYINTSAGLAEYGAQLANKYGAPLEQDELDILRQHDGNVSCKTVMNFMNNWNKVYKSFLYYCQK